MYKTAQEVLETGGKRRKPVVDTGPKVKVIDMTGKEQRVLSGALQLLNNILRTLFSKSGLCVMKIISNIFYILLKISFKIARIIFGEGVE